MPNPIVNRRILFGNQSEFVNQETLAYINATQSDRTGFGSAVDLLISDIKSLIGWSKFKFGLLSPVNLDDSLSVVDLKTATILSGAALKGTTDTGNRDVMATPFPTGFHMKVTGDYIKTGAIPTNLHSVNDTCIAHGVLENVTGGATFNYSAFQGAANSLQANFRSGGNSAVVDNYSNTANAGRNTFAGVTDQSGDWIVNRRSATDLEVYRNGVSVGTAANGGGGLPNIEVFLGAQNNAGTPGAYKNHICPYHLEFSSLTSAERNSLITIINNYKSNLGNLGTLTRNLIWDGNSLSKYENQNLPRASQYYAYTNLKKLYRFRNFAVPGQTTADALADYATQPALEYSASYTKNIYVIHEVRNDIYTGATVAQAKINIDALIDAAQATGFTVVVICPNLTSYVGNTGRTETQFNLAIDEMYSYLVANAAGAEYVVQITDTDLWVPRSNYGSDAAYNTAIASKILGTKFLDGTHLTPSGYNSIGNMIATQALNLIN